MPTHNNHFFQPENRNVAIGKCAKLHTVAASKKCISTDDITPLLLVRATDISVLFFAHIPFAVNRTFNATPTERLQKKQAFCHCSPKRLLFQSRVRQEVRTIQVSTERMITFSSALPPTGTTPCTGVTVIPGKGAELMT